MRLFLYLTWIVLIIIGASFALLNSTIVPINYFLGQREVYFPLLLLFLLFVGVMLGAFALLPTIIKLKAQNFKLKHAKEPRAKEPRAQASGIGEHQ